MLHFVACNTQIFCASWLCRKTSESVPKDEQNHVPVTQVSETNSFPEHEDSRTEQHEPEGHGVNGVERSAVPAATTPVSTDMDSRLGERGCPPPSHPNGWANYGSSYPSQENIREMREVQPEPHENTVLRRGFVPRTGPERMAQRKSSMTQLQQWVNQRRGMTPQEDLRRYGCALGVLLYTVIFKLYDHVGLLNLSPLLIKAILANQGYLWVLHVSRRKLIAFSVCVLYCPVM